MLSLFFFSGKYILDLNGMRFAAIKCGHSLINQKTHFMKRFVFVMAFAMGIFIAQARQANPLASVPVTDAQGYLTNGNFEVKKFIGKQGQVWAIGILRGTIGG